MDEPRCRQTYLDRGIRCAGVFFSCVATTWGVYSTAVSLYRRRTTTLHHCEQVDLETCKPPRRPALRHSGPARPLVITTRPSSGQLRTCHAPQTARHTRMTSSHILGEIQGQFDGVNGEPHCDTVMTPPTLSRTSAEWNGLAAGRVLYYERDLSMFLGVTDSVPPNPPSLHNSMINLPPISTQYLWHYAYPVVAQAGDTPRINDRSPCLRRCEPVVQIVAYQSV